MTQKVGLEKTRNGSQCQQTRTDTFLRVKEKRCSSLAAAAGAFLCVLSWKHISGCYLASASLLAKTFSFLDGKQKFLL